MDLLTVLAVAGVVAPVGFTAHRILGRARRFAEEQTGVRVLRGFADAFARELEVGALPVVAAGHALDAVVSAPEASRPGGVRLVEQLGVEIRRIRLGAVPGPAAVGEPGTDPVPDEGLRRLLAVWASAYRHGTALGRLAGRVRDDLDARLTHLGHTSGALAGARLTETILLLLPVGAVGVGQSMGLHPVAFLLGNTLGVLLLVGGVLLGCSGALWTESLTVTVLGGVGRRAGPDRLAAARLLDLFAESLAAGLPAAVAWGRPSTAAPRPGETAVTRPPPTTASGPSLHCSHWGRGRRPGNRCWMIRCSGRWPGRRPPGRATGPGWRRASGCRPPGYGRTRPMRPWRGRSGCSSLWRHR